MYVDFKMCKKNNYYVNNIYRLMIFTINSKNKSSSVLNTKKNNNNLMLSNNSKSIVKKPVEKPKKQDGSLFVVNSYASKNPSLFGTGKVDSLTKKKMDEARLKASKAPIGSMFARIHGLKTGCSSCGGKK